MLKPIVAGTFLIIPCIYGEQFDEEKFYKMTENKIMQAEYSKDQLYDSFDVYTYYYLHGKIAGILEARVILQKCKNSQ